MKVRAILLSFMLLTSSPMFARKTTDVIVMKNGDRMTCEIKQLRAGVLSVSLDYVDGTISVQWSAVARVESKQLFLVQTEDGTVYTGKLTTAQKPGEGPMRIQVVSSTEKKVEISQKEIVRLDPTDVTIWQRFSGAVNTGLLYSKGNDSTQYNISSVVGYHRERWSTEASFNSSLSSSSNTSASTRNQLDLDYIRLLRRNNWFYAAKSSFLQSSVQGINLETGLGGGIGRYLWNTNRTSYYLLGGLTWQNTRYETYTTEQSAQNAAAALFATELKLFKFKKTNLDISASALPGLSDPGRIRTSLNATYYIKVFGDLSWNFSFYGNWDNQPPATLSGSDYGTSSGLSWTFGNR